MFDGASGEEDENIYFDVDVVHDEWDKLKTLPFLNCIVSTHVTSDKRPMASGLKREIVNLVFSRLHNRLSADSSNDDCLYKFARSDPSSTQAASSCLFGYLRRAQQRIHDEHRIRPLTYCEVSRAGNDLYEDTQYIEETYGKRDRKELLEMVKQAVIMFNQLHSACILFAVDDVNETVWIEVPPPRQLPSADME